jgi:DNA repair ATPase RecN
MKKIFAILFVPAAMLMAACNNSADTKKDGVTKTKADSLLDEVDDGHAVAMGKMGKLNRTEQEISRLIDSIGKLPAKAREAAAPYKTKLENLLEEVKTADVNMNQWMESFNMDSALNNTEERIRYLTTEKLKVNKVKDAVVNSLQKADSVLKAKF